MIFFTVKIKKEKLNSGFTLVELLVATTLFTIIAVSGVAILLASQRAYQRISDNREAVDNINLVMDSISREARYGRGFNCINNFDFNTTSFSDSSLLNTCQDVNNFTFIPESTTTRVVYYLNTASSSINMSNFTYDGSKFTKTDSHALTSDNFNISQFLINISGNSQTDDIQSKVKILVSGIVSTVKSANGTVSTSTFSLETVTTQRLLDN